MTWAEQNSGSHSLLQYLKPSRLIAVTCSVLFSILHGCLAGFDSDYVIYTLYFYILFIIAICLEQSGYIIIWTHAFFSPLFLFFYCGKNHIKFTVLIILSVHCSSVNYMYIVMQQISRTFLSCKPETLYSLNNYPLFLLLASGKYHFTFYSWVWLP